MKYLPLLINAEQVRAILARRMTQARRPCNPQPEEGGGGWFWWKGDWDTQGSSKCGGPVHGSPGAGEATWTLDEIAEHGPFGVPGDRLWVRETCYRWSGCGSPPKEFVRNICYADNENLADYNRSACLVTVPSIHMPRRASRITLEVKRVWAEKVQDISPEDCEAEGLLGESKASPCNGLPYEIYHSGGLEFSTPREAFECFWDDIYGKTEFASKNNPWIWACEFEMLARAAT